jgi:hypothetical protein
MIVPAETFAVASTAMLPRIATVTGLNRKEQNPMIKSF